MLKPFACLIVLLPIATLIGQPTPTAPLKVLPPPGIVITDADRAGLTAGAAALQAEIQALTRELSGNPTLSLLLPDVEVLHKAVDWALRYDQFYAAKEIAFARHLLDLGHARAGQLRAQQAPWLSQTGTVLRGYRSRLDGSVQPYGLFVPTPQADGPVPLLVWLLGRNERRSELAFLAEREADHPPILPKNTVVVIPYGRFCNATKFAGEVDVMEALAAARRQFHIDPLRIAVGGFSMGGGSTWHLATHNPGLWCAAAPGAGFAETPAYTKALAPGREPRPAWEQTLWRLYDATGYAENLSSVPTVAYSGELDPQKQAAEIMQAALASEGLSLEHFIGPQTAHKYHPETKAALTRRLDALIAQGRDPLPREVRFTTFTLRYPQSAWVRVEGLERHWERAQVHATLTPLGGVTAKSTNVTLLSFPGIHPPSVTLDGQTIDLAGDRSTPANLRFARDQGIWRIAADPAVSRLRKQPGLTGPVNDAFMESFLFVRPSGRPLHPALGQWAEGELSLAAKLWHDLFRGHSPVKRDTEVDAEDIASKNLILWGDPSSNAFIARILKDLPLVWDAKTLQFRGQTYDASVHAPILIFPNPLNPERYVVLNSGIDFRSEGSASNALQTPKLPDWAIVDLRVAPGPRWPGRVVNAGFFDESWR